MRTRRVIAVAACALVAGCGTLLDIQPDAPAVADGGGSVGDGSGGADGGGGTDGGPDAADAADTADAAATVTACDVPLPTNPCVLARNLVDLGSIAVGGGYVYFARHDATGAILRVPVAGGTVTQFSGSNSPTSLFATATDLYWVTEGDKLIAHQPFGGTMSQASMNGATTTAAQIVVANTMAFWTIPGSVANDGQVRLGPAAMLSPGGPLSSNDTMPTALAADVAYVYFATKTTTGHVVRITAGATDRTTSTDAFDHVGAIALSGASTVAITTLGGVYRASTTSNATFQGPWTKVSPTTTGVAIVAGADGTFYVLDADGSVEVVSNATSPVITKRATGCTEGRALATDGIYLYAACADTIVRLHIAN